MRIPINIGLIFDDAPEALPNVEFKNPLKINN